MSCSIAGNSAPFCSTAHAIAFVHRAAGEPGERLQAILQRLQLIQLQMQVGRKPPMREHEAQHRDYCAGEHPTDSGNHASIRSTARGCSPDVKQQASMQVRCGGSIPARRRAVITDLWYKNAIVYSLDLETFMDGNGDGCGDFHGLMQRLDYLESLGIDVLWLAPFQPSPNRDNGYDISDFYGVDPRHGSSGEFVEFMNQANKRGIGVIIDLVVNHTSDRHPWFQAARSDAKSPLRDWYIWSKKRPAGWNKGMVFPGVQKSVWTLDKKAREYYYHVFYDFQPDLNMNNPDVRAEIMRIMGYWLQLGVAGFRVDAVPFVIQDSPLTRRKTPKLHFDWLEEMRRFLQWRSRDAIMLGEANVLPKDNMRYFGDEGQGIQMMFNFFVNQHLFYALASEDVGPLAAALQRTADIPNTAQWAQFLRNHDELDLGRLTRASSDRPCSSASVRIRKCSCTAAAFAAASRRCSATGATWSWRTACCSRCRARRSFATATRSAWARTSRCPSAKRCARRCSGAPSTTPASRWRSACRTPVITEGVYGCEQVNVEKQRRDPQSFLNWLVRMIRQRKETPEIGWGTCSVAAYRAQERARPDVRVARQPRRAAPQLFAPAGAKSSCASRARVAIC